MTLTQNQFYCVSCRHKVTVPDKDICYKTYNNTRTHRKIHALRGVCKCDTNLTKFISADIASKMKAKYGSCIGGRKSARKSRRKSARKSRSMQSYKYDRQTHASDMCAGRRKKSCRRNSKCKITKSGCRKRSRKSRSRSRSRS